MTKPNTGTFGNFLIQVGDGASPEMFSAPCGFTNKAFNETANMQETSVPDCTDPDAPAYVERAVDTLSSEINASGVLAMPAAGEDPDTGTSAFNVFRRFYSAAVSKNCRIYLQGVSGGYYEGKYILSQFNKGVQKGQKINVDITLSSDGEWDWVPA